MEETENVENGPVPKADDSASSSGKSCALCGCSTPAVRCDRCSSQMFCLSCDDMYHRHPKRRLHLRKAVDSIWNSARSPRLRRHIDLPGDPSKIPIPPPRSKKRERHTIGGRIFLKSGLELGSFGHSRVFDLKDVVHPQKDFSVERKSPAHVMRLDSENGINSQGISIEKVSEPSQIYENENVAVNEDQNGNGPDVPEHSPWNASRPNISSPIQVSIPSGSPDMLPTGQSFGYPAKPHSQSAADLTGASVNTVGHHPYHFPHPYPYMHPPMHPPYSHSMAHLNCAQCLSSSWSNLMSPHPSPYFHPMPWGSAHSTLARNQQMAAHGGQVKHSHGDLISYPDSGFHYPYPGGAFYANGPPPVDPNFVKELHQHAEMKKSPPASKDGENTAAADSTADGAASDIAPGSPINVSTQRDFQNKEDDEPKVPEKPTEPWSCLHCTFINPPGIFVCQVCCKTSYGNVSSAEDENEARAIGNRDSESPMELINRDAFVNSDFSEHTEAQKVI